MTDGRFDTTISRLVTFVAVLALALVATIHAESRAEASPTPYDDRGVDLPNVRPTGSPWIGSVRTLIRSPGTELCLAFTNTTGGGGICDPASWNVIRAKYVTQGDANPPVEEFQAAAVAGITRGAAVIRDTLGSCFPPQLSASLLPPPGLTLYRGDAQLEMVAAPGPLTSAVRVQIDEEAGTYQVVAGGIPALIRTTAPRPPADSPCFGNVPDGFFDLGVVGVGVVFSEPKPLPVDRSRLSGASVVFPQGPDGPSRTLVAWNLVSASSPPPVAVADEARTRAGRLIRIDVLRNDSGLAPLRIANVGRPTCGRAWIRPHSNVIAYWSRPSSCTTDAVTFTYTVSDGVRESDPATVTIHVFSRHVS